MSEVYMRELQKLNLEDKFLFDETMEDETAYADTVSILLEPGATDFNQLNDSCLILVAPFDIFGRGLYRYTFEGVCRECPDLKLNDGSARIFINTKGTNAEEFSKEFLDFMEYITDTSDAVAESTGSERIKRIHKKVTAVRKSEKAGVKLMQKWEELAYARQEGYESGETAGYERGETAGYERGEIAGYEKSKLQIARNLKAEGIPEEMICRVAGMSLEELQKLEELLF